MGMTDVELEQHDKLNSIIKTLNYDKSGSIVLIGDIMLDCYIHGYANNLNSRAPVPVLRETHREEDVGAAAHVARGLQSMGYNGRIFGAVGDDKAGSKILEYLDGENVETSGIAIIEDRITTVKTRMLASRESLVQGEQLLLRWDVEEDEPIPENALEAIYDQAIANLDNADCVILSDYGQGVIYDSGAERITKQAKNLNMERLHLILLK